MKKTPKPQKITQLTSSTIRGGFSESTQGFDFEQLLEAVKTNKKNCVSSNNCEGGNCAYGCGAAPHK